MTGTLPEPEPATRTAHPEKSETNSIDGDKGESQSGGSRAESSDEDPFIEKTPKPRPMRMALQRTYSKPTYPKHTDRGEQDLEP